jgi:ACT domain-containing protein
MAEPVEPPATENVLITVVGQDRVGIIARVANVLAEHQINILDVNQKIVQGYFVMMMMADVKHAKIDLEALGHVMDGVGEELGMRIIVQHENIFKAMHRI